MSLLRLIDFGEFPIIHRLMADEGGKTRLKAPRKPDGFDTLVTTLGGGVLDFSAMLAIADILPVMTGYADANLVIRFVNKPLAEWLGMRRKDVLGKHMRELLGEEAFAEREVLLAEALAGDRKFFASEFDYPGRGPVAVQTDYVPWADANGRINGWIQVTEF